MSATSSLAPVVRLRPSAPRHPSALEIVVSNAARAVALLFPVKRRHVHEHPIDHVPAVRGPVRMRAAIPG